MRLIVVLTAMFSTPFFDAADVVTRRSVTKRSGAASFYVYAAWLARPGERYIGIAAAIARPTMERTPRITRMGQENFHQVP